MKTTNKSNTQTRMGMPGGMRNDKRNDNHPHQRKTNSFFRNVPESKRSGPQHRTGSSGVGPPSGKNGPGVKQTTSFKPKHQERGHDRSNNHSRGPHKPKGPHRGHQKAPARGPSRPVKQGERQSEFTSKPEKVNFCLAPERLEAQARAMKHFERQEKEKALQQRKDERNKNHKIMTLKTRKGQPVMQGRMELLFEKVKKSVGVI
ncbi:thyroid transcription factor 1-associated protein 26-like [Anopheles ziemanni]|uniref:thyroid transcription factor 1-associated protein 26-like n=1 Tax=Anopheles coustani TaxID=139045 RepID=UPI00265934E8|nr:thyroid transcription factor 1-associated protein 26-like [Anopheles coustani]XP_058173567.1 thyroid transcription factor 1-associated protein 26-like [Anopheles ziemanni]